MIKERVLWLALVAALVVLWLAGRCRPAPDPGMPNDVVVLRERIRTDSIAAAERDRVRGDSLRMLAVANDSLTVLADSLEERRAAAVDDADDARSSVSAAEDALAGVKTTADSLALVLLALGESKREAASLRVALSDQMRATEAERQARINADLTASLWEARAGAGVIQLNYYRELASALEEKLADAMKGCRVDLLVASFRCPSTLESVMIGVAATVAGVIVLRDDE